jgi:hypothetical protein
MNRPVSSVFFALSPDTHPSFRPVQTSLSAATPAPFLFEVAALPGVKDAGSPIDIRIHGRLAGGLAGVRALGEPQAISAKNIRLLASLVCGCLLSPEQYNLAEVSCQ